MKDFLNGHRYVIVAIIVTIFAGPIRLSRTAEKQIETG
jgi:hypothetical protein